MNSLYNDFKPNQMGQMGNLINQFNQFRSTFSGNPEAQVRQLLQSGRMSQEQFNQFAQTANQLRQLLK
jgi:ABC-type transporter Mla subunit MlaD